MICKKALAGCFLAAVVLVEIACEDGDLVCPRHTVQVSGEVLAYYCDTCVFPNNIGVDCRYTIWTGRRAEVTFSRIDGVSYSVETDDSSAFHLALDPDTYLVVVLLPHAWPDTFPGRMFGRDTALALKIIYDYRFADSVDFRFYYPEKDTAGRGPELAFINKLNRLIGLMVQPDGAVRRIAVFEYGIAVTYRAPLQSGCLGWQVYDAANHVLDEMPEEFPHLSVDPGFYVCMF